MAKLRLYFGIVFRYHPHGSHRMGPIEAWRMVKLAEGMKRIFERA